MARKVRLIRDVPQIGPKGFVTKPIPDHYADVLTRRKLAEDLQDSTTAPSSVPSPTAAAAPPSHPPRKKKPKRKPARKKTPRKKSGG